MIIVYCLSAFLLKQETGSGNPVVVGVFSLFS